MTSRRFDIRIATEDRTLVDIRDFQVPLNRMTFLFGESGIGKSLIARAIYGLLDPEEFEITINGEPYESHLRRPETREIRENSFYVFQEPSTHLNPLMTLQKQMNEGSLADARDDREILEQLLGETNGEEGRKLLGVYPKPYRPSGGEKQRMFLMMALKKIDLMLQQRREGAPCMFVFDEPTGSLDNNFRNVFLSLLFKRFHRTPFTTLLITHDYSMVSEVTRSYRDLMESVVMNELRFHGNRLALNEFQPRTYLGWLEQQKKDPARSSRQGVPLLRVESGAVVFGQRLEISKDPSGAQVCPLEIFPGTLVYLKAPSGTGKTTIVKMMMGLIRGDRLQLSLSGMELTEKTPRHVWQHEVWGRKMTMAFQHADEALNPRSTVRETFQGLPSKEPLTRDGTIRILNELFDIDINDEFLNKHVSALSGGQKQRLNLLRCLALNTDILILDEPLNGLDFESATKVLRMMQEKQHAAKGILLISHNEEMFEALIPQDHIYYLQARPIQPGNLSD